LGFEIQEPPDIIRVIVLLNLSEGKTSHKSLLEDQIDKVSIDCVCVEMSDLEKTLDSMVSDGLVRYDDDSVQLTEQGIKLGKEWQSSPEEGADPRNCRSTCRRVDHWPSSHSLSVCSTIIGKSGDVCGSSNHCSGRHNQLFELSLGEPPRT